MWNKIRARLGSDWPVILATLLAANLVFVLLLQMQRTEFYSQQVMMMNALQGASTSMTKREEERHKQFNLMKMDMLAHFNQVELSTNQIPVIAGKQAASLETVQKTSNDVIAILNQVQLGTNQIPVIAGKNATSLEQIEKNLNEALARLARVEAQMATLSKPADGAATSRP